MFKDSKEVAIVWNNGVCFYQSSTYSMYSGETALVEELNALGASRQGLWLTGISSGFRMNGDGLYFVKPYTDIDSGHVAGYVILKLNEPGASFELEDGEQRMYLFGSDGLLLKTNDDAAHDAVWSLASQQARKEASRQLAEELEGRARPAESIRSTMKLSNGWTVLLDVSLRGTMQALDSTIGMMFAILAVVMAVMLGVLGGSIARTIRPIRRLCTHMLSNTGELPKGFDGQADGEIGVLIDSYNRMIRTNRELVEQLLEGRQRQKELELSLLQAQIKPHFLYNTLDTIYCLNAMGRAPEAAAMTKLLSEYYRLSLNNGMEQVSLRDELEMARIYLEIQSVRYKSILSYEVQPDPGANEIRVPKLLLQPLVENAIYHGIKPAGRPGRVTIAVRATPDGAEIRVRDDGVGFDPERFAQIIRSKPGTGPGYGLSNVAERLRLYYGDRCRLELEPSQKGTSILICVFSKGA